MPRDSPAARAAMTSRFSKQIDRTWAASGSSIRSMISSVVPSGPTSQHLLRTVESEPVGVPGYETMTVPLPEPFRSGRVLTPTVESRSPWAPR